MLPLRWASLSYSIYENLLIWSDISLKLFTQQFQIKTKILRREYKSPPRALFKSPIEFHLFRRRIPMRRPKKFRFTSPTTDPRRIPSVQRKFYSFGNFVVQFKFSFFVAHLGNKDRLLNLFRSLRNLSKRRTSTSYLYRISILNFFCSQSSHLLLRPIDGMAKI